MYRLLSCIRVAFADIDEKMATKYCATDKT